MSGKTFDWATAKHYDYQLDYEFPEGHSMHVDAFGNIALRTTYRLPIEDEPGVSAGVLRVLVEDHPEASVFVSAGDGVNVPADKIDTATICGPGFAFHVIHDNQ